MSTWQNPITFWIKNARPIALPQSLLPAVLALVLSLNYIDTVSFINESANNFFSNYLSFGILAILGVMFAHLAMNLWDDYFDWRLLLADQAAGGDAMAKRRPTKCTYLADGSATVSQLRYVALVFSAFALVCAGVLFYFRGMSILILLAILIMLGLFYSAPPLKLSYHGWGELVIGILMGPALMSGVIAATIGELPPQTLLVTIAVGLLVTAIVYVHSMLDLKADAAVDKKTLASVLKTDSARLLALIVMLIAAYLLLLVAIMLDYLPPVYAAMFLTVPISAQLIRSMGEYYQFGDQAPSQPKAWQGPFGSKARWQIFVDRKMDWFMYRWLLARNNLAIFCLLGITASLINVIVK